MTNFVVKVRFANPGMSGVEAVRLVQATTLDEAVEIAKTYDRSAGMTDHRGYVCGYFTADGVYKMYDNEVREWNIHKVKVLDELEGVY